MNPVFHRIPVTQIGDPDFGTGLADTLNAALALFQPSRIPGLVDIDQSAEPLQIETLGHANFTPTGPQTVVLASP